MFIRPWQQASRRDLIRPRLAPLRQQLSHRAGDLLDDCGPPSLRRSERRPIDIFNDMRMGRTVFTRAGASVTVERGAAGVVSGSMVGPGVSVSLAGSIDIVGRRLLARATATQTGGDGAPTPNGPRLDFDLAGPWSAPTIKPFVGG